MADPLPHPAPHVPVCGIGASAGGIEALQRFFRDLPADLGLAYIVVMHLAPDHRSELPAIIGRWTPMPVVQVADREKTTIAPNHVYVIAPDRKLEITDTSVASSPFQQPRGQRSAIDLFFRSLAVTHGDSFAVVLSGSGSDGAVGAKAVKERGGLVLVQDPSEAAHSGMPRAAIGTGVADLVLPIDELVARLTELARNKERIVPAVLAPDGAERIPDEEQSALKRVLDVLRTRTGHDFSGYKRSSVLRRISRRMQLTTQSTIASYLTLLRANAGEVQALFDDLLISVTTFFRDPDAWDALRTEVVGPLVERAPAGEALRVWVPACATGEEAYSLAILFHEEIERRKTSRELTIFATDVDTGALAIAREGLYPRAISADLSDSQLERFFRTDGEHYRVVGDIRDHVVFAAHSILRDPPFSRLHLVSCRNLLIYLRRELQEHVMRVFRYACREGGFLFVGASETASEDLFATVDQGHRIYFARPGVDVRLKDLELSGTSGAAAPATLRQPRSAIPVVPAELHIAALEDVSPPSVLVDERSNVLHVSSSAARYFQQRGGPLARRLTDLVRPELRDEVHPALEAASGGPDPYLSPFVDVDYGGARRRIGMLAQQRMRPSGERQILVTFLDAGPANAPESPPQQLARGTVAVLHDKLHDAEQRIENIRDDYYLTVEELRAANEELQSLNEEYRSTTEELETSKEELQSTNEELLTINQELKVRLDEVSRAHSDIENLMAATNVATLFLDAELRIKRYTQQLAEIFNVKARDVDRPIGDLRHTLDYDQLEDDCRRVLGTTMTVERHATSRDGRLYVVRSSPYRTATDHRADGVVVTFVDVTEIRRAEVAILESAESKAETSQVREFVSRLVHVQEEERRRISRDIHDQMGQQMTALRMHLEALRLQCGSSPELLSPVTHVESLAEELDQSVDFLTWELRPAALDQLGLSPALADMVRGWSERFQTPAEYRGVDRDIGLPGDTAVNLYRIAQEALHNVRKHAAASQVTVLLDVRDSQLTLVIEDNGRGFTPDSQDDRSQKGNLGLISMRERARLIGGEILIESTAGQGTSIFVRVPLTHQAMPNGAAPVT